MRIVAIFCMIFLCSTSVSSAFNLNKLGSLVEQLPKPSATLEKFDIKQISLRDITFTFDIAVHNPYMIDLTLAGVDLDFSVEKNHVFRTTTVQGFSLKARQKTVTSFDVTLTYEAIIKLIRDYNNRDYLTCDTDGLIKIPIPKSLKGLPPTIDIPFKISQKIPAIKPKVTIANFKVTLPTAEDVQRSLEQSAEKTITNLDADKVWMMFDNMVSGKPVKQSIIKPEDIDLKFKVGFDIVLQNQTKAPLDFTSLQFGFLVNSKELVKGSTKEIRKTGATTVLSVVNEFSSRNLTESVIQAFEKGTGAFTLTGGTTIQLPPEILDHPLQLEFKEDGNFNLR